MGTTVLTVKPFLRWAGGKTWLTKNIENFLPQEFQNYHEPFLGGGSIFFHLKANGLLKGKSFLSDSNENLINSYKVLKMNPKALVKELSEYKNTKKEYYQTRDIEYDDPTRSAARFIFLNRTSFNGIYRENLNGIYNVPYGYKKYKTLFDKENFDNLSELLKGTHLSSCPFNVAIKKIKSGDLVFLDPPYTVAHENNGFVKYNQKIFSWEDQIKLRDNVIELNRIGAYFIMTNAFHVSIKELYKGIGSFKKLERFSVVGGTNAKREKYHEILITNVKA